MRPWLVTQLTRLAVEPAIGAPYLTVARWLDDFFCWPDERRADWQREQLAAVVEHAQRAVPRYRSLLGDARPRDVWLGDLPVIDKATIRDDFVAHCSEGWEQMPHLRKRTGGTTGDPWQYPLDKRAWTHLYGAAIHFWERTGYRYGERLVLLGSPPSLHPETLDVRARLRFKLENRIVSTAGVAIDPATSLARARSAARARGTLWYGYASSVAAMADAALEHELLIRPPKAIVTTSEPLQPVWRQRIIDAFGAPIYDQYGCNDGGVLAQTCDHGRFHIAENVSVIEVLDADDRPVKPGEEGDVVVTNLHARVLPFLRYRIGDRAVLGSGTCPCGTPGRFFERLGGRDGDALHLPDGRRIAMPALTHCFWDTEHVRRWQIVQRAPDEITIRLEVDAGYDEREETVILEAIRRQIGELATVRVTTAEALEQTPGGKHRVVIGCIEPP